MAESGPVWKVFGAPVHEATRALLQPLEHALPDELRQRLQAQLPAGRVGRRVVEAIFTGADGLEPDLSRMAAVLGTSVRLLHGGIDRIQGHAQGRLLLALDASTPTPLSELVIQKICHQAKELGYVADPV